MTSIRIGFVGDPHIARADRWVDAETSLRMHAEALTYSFELCRRHHCTHAVVLGDTFDKPFPNQDQLVACLRVLGAYRDMGILVLMGNHDVHDAGTNSLLLLSELPAAGGLTHVTFALRRRVVRWDGRAVLCVPWGTAVPPVAADLLVFHDAVAGARRDNDTVSPRGLAGVLEFDGPAIGGHLHTPQRMRNVAFPGTVAQLSFGEREGKRFTHATLRRGREPEVVDVPVASPWTLRRVAYDADEPPDCSRARTYYSLDIGRARPGPRWLVDNPRVVTMHGGKSAGLASVASRVVNLMERSSTRGLDDQRLLARWLRQYSNLDALQRARAARMHERLIGSSGE